VIARITPEQLTNPTPCEKWDVQAIIDHLIDNARWFAAAMGRPERDDQTPDSRDLEATYRAAAAEVQLAMQADGASEVLLDTRLGEMPAGVMYTIGMTDNLLHGWDLAVATGQDATIDPDLIAATTAFVQPAVEAGMTSGAYAPALPVDPNASAQERLIALVGRQHMNPDGSG
jgi:uncharacterized protein (TIGR03086 family)